jgi:hypothetical protein
LYGTVCNNYFYFIPVYRVDNGKVGMRFCGIWLPAHGIEEWPKLTRIKSQKATLIQHVLSDTIRFHHHTYAFQMNE